MMSRCFNFLGIVDRGICVAWSDARRSSASLEMSSFDVRGTSDMEVASLVRRGGGTVKK